MPADRTVQGQRVKPWQSEDLRPNPWGRWHREELPALHPSGRYMGMTDLDAVEWRTQDGRRQPVALLEVLPLSVPLDAALPRRAKGLEALEALSGRSGVPLFLVRADFHRDRFEVRTWPGLRVELAGSGRDLAEWLVSLPAPPPSVTVRLTAAEAARLAELSGRWRTSLEALVETVLRAWLERTR
ncbi:MAG: hypothetical protein QN143_06015 [Armatimonadota bacterium]|nr:hypothetical protein [Armatimonadota bacterium]